jgi:hypothetical protein
MFRYLPPRYTENNIELSPTVQYYCIPRIFSPEQSSPPQVKNHTLFLLDSNRFDNDILLTLSPDCLERNVSTVGLHS